jgi:hypothetical protein
VPRCPQALPPGAARWPLLQERLKEEFQQEDILIVEREVETL